MERRRYQCFLHRDPAPRRLYWAEICWAREKGRGWGARHEVRTLGHEPGEDLHLKVEIRGDEFKAYVNGQIKTIFRSREFPKPKIALYFYRQSDQYWDNVVVRSLTAPTPWEKRKLLKCYRGCSVEDEGGTRKKDGQGRINRGGNLQTGLTRKVSREAVDAIISAITDSLIREERATLVGFGTFQVMRRRVRKGINPQARQAINIPAKNVPKFKPTKGLREKVK